MSRLKVIWGPSGYHCHLGVVVCGGGVDVNVVLLFQSNVKGALSGKLVLELFFGVDAWSYAGGYSGW